jgi:hypothetical protein
MATVIGPTPPGTGVIQLARSRAASNCTSPHSLPSGSRLMPTSTTTAPGFTHSPGTRPGLPTATTSSSARSTCERSSAVKRWQTVTVAPASNSSSAIGRPTRFEAPTTTECMPLGLMP